MMNQSRTWTSIPRAWAWSPSNDRPPSTSVQCHGAASGLAPLWSLGRGDRRRVRHSELHARRSEPPKKEEKKGAFAETAEPRAGGLCAHPNLSTIRDLWDSAFPRSLVARHPVGSWITQSVEGWATNSRDWRKGRQQQNNNKTTRSCRTRMKATANADQAVRTQKA